MSVTDAYGRPLEVGMAVDHYEHGRGVIAGITDEAQGVTVVVDFPDGSKRALKLGAPTGIGSRSIVSDEQLRELKDALPKPHADLGR